MSDNEMDTIYADFNNRVGSSLRLSCDGTRADLKRLGIALRAGLRLRVSDGDLAADGVVRWAPELDDWVVDIDIQKISDIR